jgi:hypothetical protein
MHSLLYRSAYAFGLVLVVSAVHADVRAEESAPFEAKMQCERAAEPGRVRCSVEVRTTSPRTIAWADVAILQLPEFASALKGRVGPSDATSRDSNSVKWAFGLVARRAGQGEARVRVRVVTCESEGVKCAPQSAEVRAMLNVGG